MNWKKKYKWFIKFPGGDFVEFFPDYEEMIFEDSLYKDLFHRRTIDVSLTIMDETFLAIWELENSSDPCVSLDVKVQFCNPDTMTFEDIWTGYIALKKPELFDLNNCLLEIKPETTDIYSCLIDNWKANIDLFEIPIRASVDTIIGELEYQTCTYIQNSAGGFNNTFTPCLSSAEGWTLIYRDSAEIYERNDLIDQADVYDRYVRQFIISVTQPAPGWIDIGSNKWVYTVPTKLDKTEKRVNNYVSSGIAFTQIQYIWYYEEVDFEADNGIEFIDLIAQLIPCDGIPLVSNFFGINPDGSEPDNIAYQYASDYLQELLVFQASDIINADASQNATIFDVEIGEQLEDILKFFNCKFYYDIEDEVNRLEHVSYLNTKKGIDLLDQRYRDIKDSFKFKYNQDDIPEREIFKFKYDTNSAKFDDAKIVYDFKCSNGEEDTIRLNTIVTNITEILNNDEYLNENSLFATVLVATSDGVVLSRDGIVNGHLSFQAIVEALHIFEKPLPIGIVNGVETVFESVRHTREQEVVFTIRDDQYHYNFAPQKRYKTQLGWGKVDSAKYNPKDFQLSSKLMHRK